MQGGVKIYKIHCVDKELLEFFLKERLLATETKQPALFFKIYNLATKEARKSKHTFQTIQCRTQRPGQWGGGNRGAGEGLPKVCKELLERLQ